MIILSKAPAVPYEDKECAYYCSECKAKWFKAAVCVILTNFLTPGLRECHSEVRGKDSLYLGGLCVCPLAQKAAHAVSLTANAEKWMGNRSTQTNQTLVITYSKYLYIRLLFAEWSSKSWAGFTMCFRYQASHHVEDSASCSAMLLQANTQM